ncbi:MAG TPA: hypothetical protein VFU43_00035 [Streptosporangiaceae bacterium]|nr:hypothetical protein [Streptosporangiaceae bacterium]
MPWIPVLQGGDAVDYLAHLDAYQHAGVDLRDEPLVGLGSVCRRSHTYHSAVLASRLAGYGLRLHTFGYKTTGLIASAPHIASSDSLAWSYAARRRPPLPGHRHAHCGNCLEFALAWRARMLSRVARHHPGVASDLPGIFPARR